MFKKLIIASILCMFLFSCNNDLIVNSDSGEHGERKKKDKGVKVAIDVSEYIDFTDKKYSAKTWKREDILYTLGGVIYKNGNSTIKINRIEGTVEITSDKGIYNKKENCQIYGKYSIDIQAASDDCLYFRKNNKENDILIIDNITFKSDQIPDLLTCIPLYGYSKNRIEVSSIMNGYIAMPSGTYWAK